ncbi:HNH endonuclease [Lacrimispora xylanisolvens]|uniref:HNH endonuclease n=1 Tax=Lacrimispora xylanisolvens TaxID=384636 RepID=A0A2S6HJ78_9FIRM|nr:HNH endonuclease signature motif containing protein [Hungatella xylanolytica]PPK77516.1 HNH endonuclease [Hungatella xylanolytica]
MGFLDGFMQGFKNNQSNKEIVDMYHEINELDTNYRDKAFNNATSKNGWYKCPKCGKNFRKSEIDIDHIVPKSQGGDNSRYNLQLLCYHCNRSKQADTSDTSSDLKKRRNELNQQDKEDLNFLNNISKNSRR